MIRVKAPSNIALLKYWGKLDKEKAIPMNSSLSMTLSRCVTETACQLKPGPGRDELTLNDRRLNLTETAHGKISGQLARIKALTHFHGSFVIQSKNSFPTGAGIASSASGFCALTIACLGAVLNSKDLAVIIDSLGLAEFNQLMVSGSGSSIRSLLPGWVAWSYDKTMGHYIQPIGTTLALNDTIALCDAGAKTFPSSLGHDLYSTSPLAEIRRGDMGYRFKRFVELLETNQWDHFGYLAEWEALNMHSVMMTSSPPLYYLNSNSVKMINFIQTLREQENIPVFFTIDAGPNIHILSQPPDTTYILKKLASALPQIPLIEDHMDERGVEIS